MKKTIKNEFETANEIVHIQMDSMTDAVNVIETVITQQFRKKIDKKIFSPVSSQRYSIGGPILCYSL